MNTPTQTPLTDAEEYAKHVIAHLYPDHSNGARLVQIALNEWLNRHLATLHAQIAIVTKERDDNYGRYRIACEIGDRNGAALNEAHAQIARMKTREGELETLIQRMLDAARGSLDYSGGHRDKDLENFHHGIQTVIRVLEAVAKSDPGDTQVNALVRIGRSAALQSVAKEGETKSL